MKNLNTSILIIIGHFSKGRKCNWILIYHSVIFWLWFMLFIIIRHLFNSSYSVCSDLFSSSFNTIVLLTFYKWSYISLIFLSLYTKLIFESIFQSIFFSLYNLFIHFGLLLLELDLDFSFKFIYNLVSLLLLIKISRLDPKR